jgi:hypothetical protein
VPTEAHLKVAVAHFLLPPGVTRELLIHCCGLLFIYFFLLVGAKEHRWMALPLKQIGLAYRSIDRLETM